MEVAEISRMLDDTPHVDFHVKISPAQQAFLKARAEEEDVWQVAMLRYLIYLSLKADNFEAVLVAPGRSVRDGWTVKRRVQLPRMLDAYLEEMSATYQLPKSHVIRKIIDYYYEETGRDDA